ncbi:alpha-lytic protease prodomain-containing protein [Streptosporangium sp. NBC_01756]|uniref:alpha-lytic protease prodomain-containing protein n=1 Tax=Streptosporangium sp. NBC_01756 TaxID=2975950 RepID=UPI002DD8680E|nr:alpha-lytic protease prodomain-containing protein [Streptosporangium sp. NBC_01756]WSC89789.1 alpha-lytic protease prodomain-containing protein [Streptosporangium sp. NBC_01756]
MAHRHAAVAGCVLAITALVPTAVPAAARCRPAGAVVVWDPPPDRWDPPPDMLEALQRDLHLTREQALTRLRNEVRLASVEAELRRRLGDRFGGSWFLGTLAQTLVVASTDPADIPLIAAGGARPKLVARSLAQLIAIKAKVDAVLSGNPRIGSVRYVDLKNNGIVILSAQVAVVTKMIKAAGMDTTVVRVVFSTELPSPSPAWPMAIVPGPATPAGSMDQS